ncbi:MAG: hypothetical protein ABJM43_04625 [Paracoccaceae bacterium]
MKTSHDSSFCDRVPNGHEQLLADTSFDGAERQCLDIARLFFNTFALPSQQHWIRAFAFAELVFDYESGARLATLILKVLQSIRISRKSVFTFSNPDCPGCARILSEHERRLMIAISSVRRGRPEHARIELMMLCEGNDTTTVMEWLEELAQALPTPASESTPKAVGSCT